VFFFFFLVEIPFVFKYLTEQLASVNIKLKLDVVIVWQINSFLEAFQFATKDYIIDFEIAT